MLRVRNHYTTTLVIIFALAVRAQALTININPGATLSGNIPALDAFNRAADQWEALFSDNITVTIDADMVNLGLPNVIGQAGSVLLQDDYDNIRNQMVADAAGEVDEAIVAALPTAAQFSAIHETGFSNENPLQIIATKANLKAMGFAGLDAQFGASDATIQFNTQFSFDFDNSNGVGNGLTDFETVAAHEIGHALGFVSVVDAIDNAQNSNSSGAVSPFALDLFRFETGTNPSTVAEFTTTPRGLTTGGASIFDDVDNEWRLSTGVTQGDGRQASHWRDNNLSGVLIGVLDPTLAAEQIFPITTADQRVYDLIGWDVDFGAPAAAITTSPGNGGTIDFGQVRVGAAGTESLESENTGQVGSTLSGTFDAGSGSYSRNGAAAFGPLDRDETDSRDYEFTPTARGDASVIATTTSGAGNSLVTLEGEGVGPVFDSNVGTNGPISFGTVTLGDTGLFQLDITNMSEDTGGSSVLTDLSILSANITGVDAALFTVQGALPGTLGELQNDQILLHFDPVSEGSFSALLTITTDQGALLGGDGADFAFALSGLAASGVPEPASLTVLASFALIAICRRRRQERVFLLQA